MNSITDSAIMALQLIVSLDPGLLSVVGRSLAVSAMACVIACVLGLMLGAWWGVARFVGRAVVLTLLNTFLAVPSGGQDGAMLRILDMIDKVENLEDLKSIAKAARDRAIEVFTNDWLSEEEE